MTYAQWIQQICFLFLSNNFKMMLALDKKMHYGYFVIDASNIHKVYAVMPALEKFTYDEGIFTEETCNRRRKQWLGFITKRE